MVSNVESMNVSKTNTLVEHNLTKDPTNDSAVPFSQSTITDKIFDGETRIS